MNKINLIPTKVIGTVDVSNLMYIKANYLGSCGAMVKALDLGPEGPRFESQLGQHALVPLDKALYLYYLSSPRRNGYLAGQ